MRIKCVRDTLTTPKQGIVCVMKERVYVYMIDNDDR